MIHFFLRVVAAFSEEDMKQFWDSGFESRMKSVLKMRKAGSLVERNLRLESYDDVLNFLIDIILEFDCRDERDRLLSLLSFFRSKDLRSRSEGGYI